MNWIRPSITFARGGRRGRSLESIYEDDQVVIFVSEDFLSFLVSLDMGLEARDSQIQHSFSRQMNPLKKMMQNLALYTWKAEIWWIK